jgi:hypothetical protein
MPKGQTPQEILAAIDWVRLLPDSAWGQGMASTADALVKELDDLARERDAIKEKIKSRMRLLRLIPGRAEREALWVHDKNIVEEAKAAAEPIPE